MMFLLRWAVTLTFVGKERYMEVPTVINTE